MDPMVEWESMDRMQVYRQQHVDSYSKQKPWARLDFLVRQGAAANYIFNASPPKTLRG